MVVYLLARDSRGEVCVVAVPAHHNISVTNTGVGPYGFYPGQDILKQVETLGIPLPHQSDLEKKRHEEATATTQKKNSTE